MVIFTKFIVRYLSHYIYSVMYTTSIQFWNFLFLLLLKKKSKIHVKHCYSLHDFFFNVINKNVWHVWKIVYSASPASSPAWWYKIFVWALGVIELWRTCEWIYYIMWATTIINHIRRHCLQVTLSKCEAIWIHRRRSASRCFTEYQPHSNNIINV